MADFHDETRPQADGLRSSDDVIVTVTATGVRDAAGQPVTQSALAQGSAKISTGKLRKERAGLARRYQEVRGDVGGLLIEMARRDHFNFHLLRMRATEALAIEQRAREIDGSLALRSARPPQSLPPGSVAMAAMTCRHCLATISADANFCTYCGAPPR